MDSASTEEILCTPLDSHRTPVAHLAASSDADTIQGRIALPEPQREGTRSRPQSLNTRNGKRLSLSFPVNPAGSASTTRQMPTSGFSTESSLPSTPARTAPSPSPHDPNGFLVLLAAQERKVLELKDELCRAEVDLEKLKKQWAIHEAGRKKTEVRQPEQQRPLRPWTGSGPTETFGTEDDDVRRRSLELERRRALLAGMSKEPRRKIMTGGHTRTLSLLSPERSTFYSQSAPSFVRTPGIPHGEDCDSLPRSSTVPDTSHGITKVHSNRARHSYQGGHVNMDVLRTGKQIAEDFKSGLWTFMEDLRQATVGDEAVNGASHGLPAARNNRLGMEATSRTTRKQGSRGSLSGSARVSRSNIIKSTEAANDRANLVGSEAALIDIGGTFWNDHQHCGETHQNNAKGIKKTGLADAESAAIADLDDDWSNWESPKESPRWSSSSTFVSDESRDGCSPSSHEQYV